MLLKLKLNKEKKKLNEYVEIYGIQDEKTMKQSVKVNNLINKYYKKHSK